jgi:hypothetical protein
MDNSSRTALCALLCYLSPKENMTGKKSFLEGMGEGGVAVVGHIEGFTL